MSTVKAAAVSGAEAANEIFKLPETVESELSERYPSWCIAEDMLYYCGRDGIVHCMKDGSGAALLSPRAGFVFSNGKDVFCGNSFWIIRLNADGSDETILKVRPLVNEAYFRMMNCLSAFTPADDKIYYILTLYENHCLYVINTDGTGNRKIGDVCNVLNTIDSIDVSGSSIKVCFTTPDGETFTASLEDQA